MRRFIIRVSLFIIPILIGLALLETLLRMIPNDYNYKRSYIEKHGEEIEVLIFGNSHTYYGIDPAYFDQSTFNLAYVSQSLDFDLKIFENYIDQLESLKVAVFPLSYSNILAKMEKGAESWRVSNYAIYYRFNDIPTLKNYSEVLSHKLYTNIVRLLSYYIKGEFTMTSSELGWGTSYKSAEAVDLYESGLKAVERHTNKDIYSKESVEIYNDNVSTIDNILSLCKERGIEAIFISVPLCSSYIQNMNKEQLDLANTTIDNITSSYDNVEYINFVGDPRFGDEDFFDGDHLSEIGAKKLSLILNEHIGQKYFNKN